MRAAATDRPSALNLSRGRRLSIFLEHLTAANWPLMTCPASLPVITVGETLIFLCRSEVSVNGTKTKIIVNENMSTETKSVP